MANSEIFLSFAAGVAAALMSAFVTWANRPALLRVALARPNARSSHRIPTPQGGGIAVMAATLIVAGVLIAVAGGPAMKIVLTVFGATLFIAVVGFIDDVNSIAVLPRLRLQGRFRRREVNPGENRRTRRRELKIDQPRVRHHEFRMLAKGKLITVNSGPREARILGERRVPRLRVSHN
jgi:hypothetical protein